jgi:anti-sigma factor RsiW
MSNPSPLSDKDRADLVAYLDGELGGEPARRVEARISTDPAVRAEADALKKAWDLLDHLPRAEPSPRFTERTLSKLAPIRKAAATGVMPRRLWLRRAAAAALWLAALAGAGWGGFAAFNRVTPRPPGDRELVADLRVVENKRLLEAVEDIDELRDLDRLFDDEAGGN